jgi:hypothetical protein
MGLGEVGLGSHLPVGGPCGGELVRPHHHGGLLLVDAEGGWLALAGGDRGPEESRGQDRLLADPQLDAFTESLQPTAGKVLRCPRPVAFDPHRGATRFVALAWHIGHIG